MKVFRMFFTLFVLTLVSLPLAVMGQDEEETLVVTPVNTRGWTTADTRPGGAVSIVLDSTSPAPGGSLSLTTDATTTAKAQYMHATETPITDVNDLSYWAKQNSASFAGGNASYQFVVCLGGIGALGDCLGFTTFVYEPYQNTLTPPSVWTRYDVDTGQMWSSRTYSSGTCTTLAGGGGAPFYTLTQIKVSCPNAVAVAFGVNIGSNNPSYDVSVDLVKFNNTTYDFEVYSMPTTADECMKGGWSTFNPEGGPYKNQGQCVSSTVPAS